MDNVTHTLFALTLARTSLGLGRGATAALVLASNAPDIDFVAAAAGAGRYLQWHRGPTHGPIGIIALGLVTAGLVWAPRRATPYARLAMVAILGVLLHVLMDLPTSYGTRILSPFDWHWFAEDWMPIIDVYLLIVLAVGLWIGARGGAARRVSVAIVLALMASDYLFRGIAHHRLSGVSSPNRPAATRRAT